MQMMVVVVVEHVHVLRVHADGLLVDADEYKEKTKKVLTLQWFKPGT